VDMRIWFYFLFIFTIYLVTGCKESTVPGVTVSDVNVIEIFMEPDSTEYSMIIIKPESNIDYKILQKVPDPNEDHAMLFVKPKKGLPEFKLNHKKDSRRKETHSEKPSFVLP